MNEISFQSHFGLILSQCNNTHQPKLRKCILSIPFWSDFITGIYEFWKTVYELSIPFWSDFIPVQLCSPSVGLFSFNPILVWFYPFVACLCWCVWVILSIPFWSDFIKFNAVQPPGVEVLFQSHFGLILSWCMVLYDFIKQFKAFQSHFGLILS